MLIKDVKTLDVIDANNKACEIFCYRKEEIIGMKPNYICTDSDQYCGKKLSQLYNIAAENGPQMFEWPVKDRFGREFWVEINAKKAVIGGQYRILSIIRDITERKQLLEHRNNFMNLVSHELRTPLSAIKEGIAIVSENKAWMKNEKQRDVLSIVKRNIDRLARLVNQVLDIQRIDAGNMEFRLEENSINEAVKEAHKSMVSLASKKKLAITLQLEENLPSIKFDKDRIVEVLINLISNAIKFTEKGTITIFSKKQEGIVQVSVKDAGVGIKSEDMARLFQRFTQLTRQPGGSGLGLAICKEIIDAHKGKIWAESKPGKGSTFCFSLPISKKKGADYGQKNIDH